MSLSPTYQIGDAVWRPTYESQTAWVECPDCCGSGRLGVIMGDQTLVYVDCQNCQSGWEAPQGRLKVYDRSPKAKLETVVGIRIDDGKIEYQTTNSWCSLEDMLFTDEAEALIAARQLADLHSREERDRVLRKEKDTRSWAWNASYHRGQIKRAREQIDYHTAKLNVASLKAKADKENVA
jgi:hypothetical protein